MAEYRKPSALQAAYAAGFFDTNGQLTVQSGPPSLKIVFRREQTDAIRWIAALYKGSIYPLRKKYLGLNLSTRAALLFLVDVRPFATVRAAEIDLIVGQFSTKMRDGEAEALGDQVRDEQTRRWGSISAPYEPGAETVHDTDRAYCAGALDGGAYLQFAKQGRSVGIRMRPRRGGAVVKVRQHYGGVIRGGEYHLIRRADVRRLLDDTAGYLTDKATTARRALTLLDDSKEIP